MQYPVGSSYNSFTILEKFMNNGESYVKIQCICGLTKEVKLRRFYNAPGKCMCYGNMKPRHMKKEVIKILLYKEKDPMLFRVYKTYKNILYRCNNDTNSAYKNYGARGIKCEWVSFEEFKEDMYKKYKEHVQIYGTKNTTIDRIDVNGNYSKDNCRWADWTIQANNRRNNIKN